MLIFGSRWPQFKPILQVGSLYFLKGKPREDRGISIMADDIFTEEEYKDKLERRAIVTVECDGLSDKFYEGMFRVLTKHPGKSEIILKLVGSEETTVSLIKRIKINVTKELKEELTEYSNGLVSCI